jgi:hypothetical protein
MLYKQNIYNFYLPMKKKKNQVWWHTPVIPALQQLRQIKGQPELSSETLSQKFKKEKRKKSYSMKGYTKVKCGGAHL